MLLKIAGTIVGLALGCMYLRRKKGKTYFNEWSIVAWVIIGILVVEIWMR